MDEISEKDEKLFIDYLDGNLVPGEKEKLEARLRNDPEFKKKFEEYKNFLLTINSLPHIETPESVTRGVIRSIRRKTRRASTALTTIELFLSLIVIILVITIFYSEYTISAEFEFKNEVNQQAILNINDRYSTLEDYLNKNKIKYVRYQKQYFIHYSDQSLSSIVNFLKQMGYRFRVQEQRRVVVVEID